MTRCPCNRGQQAADTSPRSSLPRRPPRRGRMQRPGPASSSVWRAASYSRQPLRGTNPRASHPCSDRPGRRTSRCLVPIVREHGFDRDPGRPHVLHRTNAHVADPEDLPLQLRLTPCNHDVVLLQQRLAERAVFYSGRVRSEEHTSELQSRPHLVCRLLLEKKKKKKKRMKNIRIKKGKENE